ncbi:unnamed protein product [Closterium sp. NIES-54]
MRICIAWDVDFLENVMWKDWNKAKGFEELLQDAAEISQLLPLTLSLPSAAVDDTDIPLSTPPPAPAPLCVSVQQQPAPLQQLRGPSVIQRRSATQASFSSSSSGQRHVTLFTSAPTSPATTSPPLVTCLQVLGIQSGTGGEEVGGDTGVVEGMLCLAREVEGVALTGVSTSDVPRMLAEALRGSEGLAWKAGAEKEVNAMRTMGVWDPEPVDLPPGKKAIGVKYVFDKKTDKEDKVVQHKVCLIAKGYTQEPEKDFDQVFSPEGKLTSGWVLLAEATVKGWHVQQEDVNHAYLNAVLQEEVYVRQPEGFYDGYGSHGECFDDPAAPECPCTNNDHDRWWFRRCDAPVEVVEAAAEVVEAAEAVVEAAAAVVEVAAAVVLVEVQPRSVEALVVASTSNNHVPVRPRRPSSFVSGTLGMGGLGFPDAVELPRWGDRLRQNVAIFDLDFDAILAVMYALTDSAEGDCYLSVPPDPGIEAAALGASASAAPGTGESATPGAGESDLSGNAPTEALHTFTLDSGASRSFFRNTTTLTPLRPPVAVSLADPSGGPVLAHSSMVLPCRAALSGLLSGLHLPSFSTNLRVTHCTCSRTGCHLATFTRRPGSSLYALTTTSPPVSAFGQVAASSQVFAAASRSSPTSAPCSCRPLSHETLLRHHRHGHPSQPHLRGMASRTLVSDLPRSFPPLPPGPIPTCVPCVEGWQRAAPHSSTFPPIEAPLQTLHMDEWGPARVRGQGHERYFVPAVDDYSRYTTVFPLRSKGEVPEGIRQTFTLPASPQKNGIAERRIGMVMDVARTSMIHAAAPHLLWPFAVQYAAHQINLQPRVSLTETTPTLRWTEKVGDASAFHVWGSRAFVRDTSANKLSSRAIPCVFLGFPPDAPGWQFYHPTSRRVLSSQDIPFDELVSYYHLFPYCTTTLPPLPLFLAPGVSQVDLAEPVEVAIDSGADRGAKPAGAGTRGADPGGAEPERLESVEPGGAEPERVEPGGTASGGAEPARAESGGSLGFPLRQEPLSPQHLREWYTQRCRRATGAAGAGGATGAAGGATAAGAGAARGAAGARDAGDAPGAGRASGAVGGPAGVGAAGAAGLGGACTGGTGAAGAGGATNVGAAGTGAGGAAGVVAGDPGA